MVEKEKREGETWVYVVRELIVKKEKREEETWDIQPERFKTCILRTGNGGYWLDPGEGA